MKQKLTEEQEKELLWVEYEQFLKQFKGFDFKEPRDSENLTNFLLYRILKELQRKK